MFRENRFFVPGTVFLPNLFMALNDLLCADVPLRKYLLTHRWENWPKGESSTGTGGSVKYVDWLAVVTGRSCWHQFSVPSSVQRATTVWQPMFWGKFNMLCCYFVVTLIKRNKKNNKHYEWIILKSCSTQWGRKRCFWQASASVFGLTWRRLTFWPP